MGQIELRRAHKEQGGTCESNACIPTRHNLEKAFVILTIEAKH
jgi:hypothetical protein